MFFEGPDNRLNELPVMALQKPEPGARKIEGSLFCVPKESDLSKKITTLDGATVMVVLQKTE